MKNQELDSIPFKSKVGDHINLYTIHEVTYKNKKEVRKLWKKWKRNKDKYKKWMLRSGIIIGENVGIYDQPLITYTSRCKDKIYLEDFKGRIRLGNNVNLHSCQSYSLPITMVRLNVVQSTPEKIGEIIIGDGNKLPGTTIISYDRISIGNNVMLGPNVIIMDSDGHTIEGRGEPDELKRLFTAPVEICDGVWIGYGAVILKGVRIGKNSVVGINSVVYESIPDNTVVAGNPAKVIKSFG